MDPNNIYNINSYIATQLKLWNALIKFICLAYGKINIESNNIRNNNDKVDNRIMGKTAKKIRLDIIILIIKI